MLHVDLPTLSDFKALAATRADACVSIYLATTPVTEEADAARIAFSNKAREAMEALEAAGLDKRRAWPLIEQLDDLAEDGALWDALAHSLAVFATPDSLRVFRLANHLPAGVHVADRFFLKPLLRAMTFPQTALVLGLSENGAELIEIHADAAPDVIRVPDMPKDAASAVGKASINDRSPSQRITGSEGKKVRLRQYARAVDAALRPVLKGAQEPLIVIGNDPIHAIFREVCGYSALLAEGVHDSPDRMPHHDMAAKAREILDAHYAAEVAGLRDLYRQRKGEGRATADVAQAARAATFGAVDTLLVDIDDVVPGAVDEQSGAVTFADEITTTTYGVVDEIAARVIANGGRVLGVRRADLPEDASLAAILRYAV